MYFEIDDFNALREALHTMCTRLEGMNIPRDAVFDSKLVANELLSNVLQHGGGRAYFRATLDEDTIVICVRSAVEYLPPQESSCSDVFSENGRGLFLVDSVCERRDYDEEDGIRVIIKIVR